MKISSTDLNSKYTYTGWKNRYPILDRYIRLYPTDHRGIRKSFTYTHMFTWDYFLYYYLDSSQLSPKENSTVWEGDLSPLVALEEKRTNNFQQLYTAIDAKVEDSVDFILSLTQN